MSYNSASLLAWYEFYDITSCFYEKTITPQGLTEVWVMRLLLVKLTAVTVKMVPQGEVKYQFFLELITIMLLQCKVWFVWLQYELPLSYGPSQILHTCQHCQGHMINMRSAAFSVTVVDVIPDCSAWQRFLKAILCPYDDSLSAVDEWL